MLVLLALLAALDDPVLAPDAEARWVPFELTGSNHIRFEMQVGGQSATAVLDTGFSHTIASNAFAERLKLRAKGGGRARAVGGDVSIRWAPSPAITLGGLSRSGGRIGVTDLSATGDASIDLYVGADLLACCALDVDYAARRFRILPSGRLPFAGATAPLSLLSGTNVFVTELGAPGGRLRPVLVDTGDGGALTLTAEGWKRAVPQDARVTTTIGYGVGGPIVTELAVAGNFTLGTARIEDVEVRREEAGGFSVGTGTAGRIGSGLLMRFRMLLDPRAGRMVLAPAATTPPANRSTSGLLFSFDGTALNILHVMRGSPAAKGAWKAGERICAANGETIPALVAREGAITWGIGAPGSEVRLTLCDGEERRLTLREFY